MSTAKAIPRPVPADEPIIRMVDVAVTYPTGKTALTNVDIEIARGEFVFLVGPSGAGKSTFIRLLVREQVATKGRVYLAGRDLARISRAQVHRIRRRIGVVFQDFRLLPNKTVRENVAFALEVTGAPLGEIRHRVPRLLALVGLEGQSEQLPAQLSGGSGRRSPGPWSTTRRSSSPTSRPGTSTRSPAGRSSSSCSRSTPWGRPWSWPPTTRRSSPPCAGGSSRWRMGRSFAMRWEPRTDGDESATG
jgi:hypothetical protein